MNTSDGILKFSLCHPLPEDKVPAGCSRDASSYLIDDQGKCTSISPMTTVASVSWKYSIESKDSNGKKAGSVNVVSDNKKLDPILYPYNIDVTVVCDTNVNPKDDLKWTYIISGKTFKVTTRSKYGCGYSVNDLVEFLNQNKYIVAPILFLIGLLMAFTGHRILRYTLFIVGFIAG